MTATYLIMLYSTHTGAKVALTRMINSGKIKISEKPFIQWFEANACYAIMGVSE